MSKHNIEKILFIPDQHIPYNDKRYWKLLLKAAKRFKPDHSVILGDFADFYSVSSHSKSPERAFKLEEELNEVKRALDDIKAIGAKNNIFIAGNHSDRLRRYLEDKAPELHKIISIPKILELDKKGFKYVPYRQHFKLGKLNITHDVGAAGRYAHYKALDTFQHNIVTAHTHRIGFTIEGDAEGKRHCSAMFGWGGDLASIDYMTHIKTVRDWSLGFGIGYLNKKTKEVHVIPVTIINYGCIIEGELISL